MRSWWWVAGFVLLGVAFVVDDPDEGGTYCTDPARRIERDEERAARERERKRRKW